MSKFYAVHSATAVGVFGSWPEAQQYVHRVKGAVHRSFRTVEEATEWLMQRAPVGAPPPAQADEDAPAPSAPPASELVRHLSEEKEEEKHPRPVRDSPPEARKRNKREKADLGLGAYFLDRVRRLDPGPPRGVEQLSKEQEAVVRACLAGHNVCIVGEAGTGKSYLLRELMERLQAKHRFRGVYCTASTGIA